MFIIRDSVRKFITHAITRKATPAPDKMVTTHGIFALPLRNGGNASMRTAEHISHGSHNHPP